jgi:hexulose-6-phosphate isomerase
MKNDPSSSLSRRHFLSVGAASVVLPAALQAASPKAAAPVQPPDGKGILISPKLGMLPEEVNGKKLSLAERLELAGEAGFDGVDLDQAGAHTLEEARDAVLKSGVFVHNAINHDHWKKRLTSPNAAERAQGVANIAHCLRLSHAAGGSGVLIVVGRGSDGDPDEIEDRCRAEIRSLIPLAASLGQPILIENVWNEMFYDHNAPPEQGPQRFIDFVDSFNSPWVGMYYDIGNHWKYGQPHEWIRGFGRRCVKLDVKGFSRAKDEFVDIGDGDLPWKQVQKAVRDIGFSGWATAEVGGGGLARLKKVREQMQRAFGL